MKNAIRSSFSVFVIAVCLLLLAQVVSAKTYTTVKSGDWVKSEVWDANGHPPDPLPAGDSINIKHEIRLMVAFNTAGAINIVGGVLSQDPNHLLVIESGGSLTVNGYSYVVLRAATIKSGGAITIAKGKTLRVIGELVVDQNATLTNDGDLLIYPDRTLTLNGGKLVNNGTVTFNANATLRSGSDETSLATIEQNGAFSFAAGSIISPGGDEAGGLAINGDIDLGKAKFLCDIKSKPYFDFIIIRGEASNLEFTVVPKWHYTPAQGSYFSIVKAEKGLKSKTLKFIEPPAPVAGLTVRYYFHKIPDFREEFYYISVR